MNIKHSCPKCGSRKVVVLIKALVYIHQNAEGEVLRTNVTDVYRTVGIRCKEDGCNYNTLHSHDTG